MRVSAYVRNKYLGPSGYYRITQYFLRLPFDIIIHSIDSDFMFRTSMQIKEYKFFNLLWQVIHYFCYILVLTAYLCFDYLRKVDVVIVSRCFLPRFCPELYVKFIKYCMKNVILIWDFDDYILGNTLTKNEYLYLCNRADKIIVTQAFLREMILSDCRDKVIFLPTTDGDMCNIDYDFICKERLKIFSKEMHILWLAMPVNLPYLKLAIKGLDKAAEILQCYGKKLVLNVVCSLPLVENTGNLIINNIKWSRKIGREKLLQCHIGIMPLADTEYNRGKGAFKLIQYMSVGMPVIASDVGYNSDVLEDSFGIKISKNNRDEEWGQAVLKLVKDEETWLQYSRNAKKEWHKKYSYDNALNFWKQILEEIYVDRHR